MTISTVIATLYVRGILNGQQKLLNTRNEGVNDSSDHIRRKRSPNTTSCISLTRDVGQKKTQFRNVMSN